MATWLTFFQDNYRIVTSHDIGEPGAALLRSNIQPHMSRRLESEDHREPGTNAYFLRQHFVQCLHVNVNIRGGNITDDHDLQDIVTALSNLGLWDDSDDEVADDDDDDCESDLGQEILRAYKASQMLQNELKSVAEWDDK